VALGLHPRERKLSVMRRLGGLLVGMAAKAPYALLVCPSAQGWANQVPGGDAPITLVCPQPQGQANRVLGGLPPGWRPCSQPNHTPVKLCSPQ